MSNVTKLNIEQIEDSQVKVTYQKKDGEAGSESFDTWDEAQAFGQSLSDETTNDPELEAKREEAADEAAKPDNADTVPASTNETQTSSDDSEGQAS